MSDSPKTPTELLASLPAGVTVPLPPTKPTWGKKEMGFSFPRPTTPSEKLVHGTFWSAVYGAGAGTVAAWFYDYKKTRMPYFKALKLHASIVSGPFKYVTGFGIAQTAMDSFWDVYNAGGNDRIEKEQTMTQKTLTGLVAGSTVGLMKASPSSAIAWGSLFAVLSWTYHYYMRHAYPSDVAKRAQLYQERFVKVEGSAPEYLHEDKLRTEVLAPTFFFEQAPKKKSTKVVFEEQ